MKTLDCIPQFLKTSQTARRLYYAGKFAAARVTEEDDLYIASKLLKPGQGAMDVGANYGLFTKFFSKAVGRMGRVFSFEPIPSTFALLRFNVELFCLDNVRLEQRAASDFIGTVTMNIPDGNAYRARILPDGHVCLDSDPIVHSVETITLDRVALQIRNLALIKIDVEGHETAVLNGAKKCIAAAGPALMIEWSEKCAAAFDDLRAAGYRQFVSSGPYMFEPRPGIKHVNHFFLKSDHIATLQRAGIDFK